MKAIAIGGRLARDFGKRSFTDLTADARLEILDAINGGLQKLDALAPAHTKTAQASLYLAAPQTVSIGVTNGSSEITLGSFTADQSGCTIRIEGDTGVDNQVAGESSLLHPYLGETGTVSAIIYSDAVAFPEPYAEIIGDPTILETGRRITLNKLISDSWQAKQIAEPYCYWMEANARNRNPSHPAIIRFYPIPDRAYRLEVEAVFAPVRVKFSDLLAPADDLPIRAEYVESYLLPICRAILTDSEFWKSNDSKASVRAVAATAEDKFSILIPSTLATPDNRVGTHYGF